jgi:hypothetical protein
MKTMLANFTPMRALAVLAAVFLALGALLLLARLIDTMSCTPYGEDAQYSLARLLLALGTASVAFLAWLKTR